MKNAIRFTPLLLSLLGALPAPARADHGSPAYEQPPVVRPTDVVSGALLQSASHRLRDDMEVEENFYRFELETDYGVYEVLSLAMLETRIHETRVLAQAMEQFRRSDQDIAVELRGQLHVGADSWVDILTSPVGTASNLAGQLAGNIGETVSEFSELPTGGGGPRQAQRLVGVSDAEIRSVASQLGLDA